MVWRRKNMNKEHIVPTAFPFPQRLLPLFAAALLTGCATEVLVNDTLVWRGKDVAEFMAKRARRVPDIIRLDCVKNNRVRNLYGWRVEHYEIKQGYAGQSGNVQYFQNYRQHVGHSYRIAVTEPDGTIVSIRTTAFGNADKEFGCEAYREARRS